MSGTGFLETAEVTARARAIFDDDVAELGYVMNVSRLWAYDPGAMAGLFELMGGVVKGGEINWRERGILVAACASALGDSYCSLVWGSRLAGTTDPHTASAVLRGDHATLTAEEQATARWARQVVCDPIQTTAADVQALRDAGLSDARIFAITVFVALRLAFSSVNIALGVRPDAQLRGTVPAAVLDAVTFGRPIVDEETATVEA